MDNLVQGATPQIVSLQVGKPRWHESGLPGSSGDQRWYSGIIKETAQSPMMLTEFNLVGDGQADAINHGGRDKAVMAYAYAHYAHWLVDLQREHLPTAAFGENFTVGNCDESQVCIGDIYKVGDAIVQVSQPRQPCWKQERLLNATGLIGKMTQTSRTGWYYRVIQPGKVATGSLLELIERKFPHLTISAENGIMYARPTVNTDDLALSACPLLSQSWVSTLMQRANS